MKDEEFVSKTINDSSVDLDKFPASKVRQLAKKMDASKATAQHIKQVASDLQAAQINLMRHQQTDFSSGKCKRKVLKQRPQITSAKQVTNKPHHTKEGLIPNKLIQVKIGVPNVVISGILNVSNAH